MDNSNDTLAPAPAPAPADLMTDIMTNDDPRMLAIDNVGSDPNSNWGRSYPPLPDLPAQSQIISNNDLNTVIGGDNINVNM